MFASTLKKSLLLLAAYSVFIFGIFILQFKNDSIVSEKIGTFHITLYESHDSANGAQFKNKFSAVFNGISFSTDDEKSVTLSKGAKETSLSLVSWEKTSPLSCVFEFTENTKIKFFLSDDTNFARMSITADFPAEYTSLYLPYTLTAGSTITERSSMKIQILNRKNSWELSASDIDADIIVFSTKHLEASYSHTDKTRTFNFASAAELASASETTYTSVIENLKTNLINSFMQTSDTSVFSEQDAVSYIAAMAEKGRYNEAIDFVPESLKKSASRTYLSAPYFNNLAQMNILLQRHIESIRNVIETSVTNGKFDVFNVRNISDYINIYPEHSGVIRLLDYTANAELTNITIQQAAGIIFIYTELAKKQPKLAEILAIQAQNCANIIEKACSLDNGTITLQENGIFLSVIHGVYVGNSILQLGNLKSDINLSNAGRAIISSYLKGSSGFDLRTMSELYPIAVRDNQYYPHFEIISYEQGQSVWAWTCADTIKYENNNAGTVTLYIDFPVSLTHYVIINGISPFRSIYIYDIPFRTDYRFESYNSSGYVYQRENETLLLKSRHRNQQETVRLVSTVVEDTSEIITETAMDSEQQ